MDMERDSVIARALARAKLRLEIERQTRWERLPDMIVFVLLCGIGGFFIWVVLASFEAATASQWLSKHQSVGATIGAVVAALIALLGVMANLRNTQRKEKTERADKSLAVIFRTRVAAVELERLLKLAQRQISIACSKEPGSPDLMVTLPDLVLLEPALADIALLPEADRERVFTVVQLLIDLRIDLQRVSPIYGVLGYQKTCLDILAHLHDNIPPALESLNALIISLQRY